MVATSAITPANNGQELTVVNENYSPVSGTRDLLVKPIATADAVRKNFEEFQKLKLSLLDPKTDIQEYKDRDGNITRRIKKSGCKKIATAFALDVQPISTETIERNGFIIVKYTVKATAPNGRSTEAVGMCDTSEALYANRKNRKLHDVDATAFTRAANRAVLDLVGGGEVSAEEITGEEAFEGGRRPLQPAWLDKLTALAKELPDGKQKLAEFVFEEIGAKYLSKEEIVKVADKLQKEKMKTATPAPLPPAGPANLNPAQAKQADAPNTTTTKQSKTEYADLDQETQERMHRAAWIEDATQIVTVSPAGKFVSVTPEQFSKASQIIANGRELADICEMMGIEKFTNEAKRRYPTLKYQDQLYAAGLHVLAEWCENHQSETIFPDVEGGTDAGEDLFRDEEDSEFDDQEEYIK